MARWVPLDKNLHRDSFTGTKTGEVPLKMTQASSVPTLQAWLGGFQELSTALLRDSKPSLRNPWKKQHKCNLLPSTAVARSKKRNVFANSNTGAVGSYPILGKNVCFPVLLLTYLPGWSLVYGVIPIARKTYYSRSLLNRNGPELTTENLRNWFFYLEKYGKT